MGASTSSNVGWVFVAAAGIAVVVVVAALLGSETDEKGACCGPAPACDRTTSSACSPPAGCNWDSALSNRGECPQPPAPPPTMFACKSPGVCELAPGGSFLDIASCQNSPACLSTFKCTDVRMPPAYNAFQMYNDSMDCRYNPGGYKVQYYNFDNKGRECNNGNFVQCITNKNELHNATCFPPNCQSCSPGFNVGTFDGECIAPPGMGQSMLLCKSPNTLTTGSPSCVYWA